MRKPRTNISRRQSSSQSANAAKLLIEIKTGKCSGFNKKEMDDRQGGPWLYKCLVGLSQDAYLGSEELEIRV